MSTLSFLPRAIVPMAKASLFTALLALASAGCGSSSPPIGPSDGGGCGGSEVVCGGLCADLQSSPQNCGACGHACGAEQFCGGGTCQSVSTGGDGGSSTCAANEKTCGGVCTDVQNNPANCGDCGISCGANSYCSGGSCLSLCAANETSCGAGASAVCVQTDSDPNNCGGCGNACPDGGFCENATCTAACTGWLHTTCSDRCVSLLTDPDNCGSCGTSCDGGTCSGGLCGSACGAGYTACGSGTSTTCAQTLVDPQNCGGCGLLCPSGDVCAYGECRPSCFGEADTLCDGLCTDTLTDRQNCGTCGHLCPGSEVCSQGSCAATCASSDVATPYTTCGSGATAYCASLQDDPMNCGGCGHSCDPGQVCSAGACATACFGLRGTPCGGSCTDTSSDPLNCGACGLACPAGQVCAEGTCEDSCDTQAEEYTTCGSGDGEYCATTGFDPQNCGSCGNECDGGACSNGVCGTTCAAGTTACGTGKDYFCTDINSDTQNCGGCGEACPVPEHGRAVSCTFGACGFACNPGFTVCGEGCCGFTQVSAGVDHTCGVTESGDVMCWGANNDGQLGDGTTTSRFTPVQVLGLADAGPAASVAAGADHSCALMANGAIDCWGLNQFGELGTGDTTAHSQAVMVSGFSGNGAKVAVGGWGGAGWTCAMTTGGAAKCWGYNHGGQLGNGTTMQEEQPTQVTNLTTGVTDIAVSVYADRSDTFSVGNVCVVNGGAPECWGNNYFGQLGTGVVSQSPQPTDNNTYVPTAVLGLSSGVVQIVSGSNYTCARTGAGAVDCWGFNGDNELGDGTTTARSTPEQVTGLSSGIVAISAIGSDTCAITHTGAALCWGYNGHGELGDGTKINRNVPTAVPTLTTGVAAISAGFNHTCAINAAGQLLCWGDNTYGQLGEGDTTAHLTPTPIQ